MSAIKIIQSVARKSLMKDQGSGIRSIPSRMEAEAEAGSIAAILQSAGLPLQQLDDYIRSEADVLKYLNIIKNANKPRVIAGDSPEGRGITEALLGKQNNIVDMTGKKIDPSQGIMGGKSVKELMDSGQVSKGARGMKKSKKVQDREMFQAANKRLTLDVDGIIKNIKSMEPITAMKEANSVIARKGKYKNLTPQQSKKILQDTEDHIFERNIPEDPEDFATGGRVAFQGGGADASTTSFSKSYDKIHGTNTVSKANKTVDAQQAEGQRDADNTNRRIEANRQAGSSEIFPPKETIIDKIKNSRLYNSPSARLLGRTALYAYNPSLGIMDARKAIELKRVYDIAQQEINNPVFNEEDLTLGLITDQQAKEIDKASKMANLMNDTGKLTDIEKNTIFENVKPFDDKGSSGVFGIGAKDAEPMTREEFDAYVKEKGYATGGRAGFNNGGSVIKLLDGTTVQIPAGSYGKYGLKDYIYSSSKGDLTKDEIIPLLVPSGASYATGGIARANFVGGGMGRREFLKMLAGLGGGIAAAKTGLLKLAGKEPAKQVAKEVVQQSTTTPPPYFFKLAEKIKKLGSDTTPTNDRTIAKSLKSKDGKSDYILEEDVTSGDTIIKKVNKEGDEMITDVEIMEFRKGEVVKGKDGKAMKTPDEYEEVTEANMRIEGDTFNDPYYSDGIEIDDILREVDDIPVPKASGGIARMLGE